MFNTVCASVKVFGLFIVVTIVCCRSMIHYCDGAAVAASIAAAVAASIPASTFFFMAWMMGNSS